MNYELRTNKGFTLIELVVAIALLSMVLGFSSVIFKTCIEAHRTTGANSEIMQKLRAITDQLNSDFKGIQKDAPMAIWFQLNPLDPNQRLDRIVFLADGDFQSVRTYEYTTSSGTAFKTVAGNVASILYMPDISNPHILVRKQKILTADDTLILSPILLDPSEFIKFSLAEWKVWGASDYFLDWIYSPAIDPRIVEEDIPRYAVDGISNFMIQLAEDSNGVLLWPPANDNFSTWDKNPVPVSDGRFIFFFNLYDSLIILDSYDQSANWPRALKFTFTLYDSKGIIKNGRTFTHIVYLE